MDEISLTEFLLFINSGFIVASGRSRHRIRQADCEVISGISYLHEGKNSQLRVFHVFLLIIG